MMKRIADWFSGRIAFLVAWLIAYLFARSADIAEGTALMVTFIVVLPALWPRRRLEPLIARPVIGEVAVSDPLAEVKSAFAGFDNPVYMLDRTASVLYQNPAALEAFGEIAPGLHISARIRLPVVLDMVRDALASGQSGQTEYASSLPTETVYHVRMIRAGGESAHFWTLIFRDISESRRIDRMRSDFVANASHELRTPLASLRGFIETLQGAARNDPKAQERFLAIMLEQVTRMSRLVDDLMSLSRLELKARLAPDEAVDLVPLVNSVCDVLIPLADGLDVKIRRQVPQGPVMVRGDRDELTQVFENLIENACKYGQDGKFVDVALKPGEKTSSASGDAMAPEVSVTDFGPGIPEDHVPRLTERFYRVNVESSRSKKGTGLGLAIVKHILTRHKARLLIRSQLGKGSSFTVKFQE